MLAIIGSGVQARSHLEAIGHVRALREVRVWSPTRGQLPQRSPTRCSREIAAPDRARRRRAQDAVDGADIVVLATASREPVAAERVDRGRRAHLRRRRLPARSARDGHRARRARAISSSIRATGALAEAGDIVLPIEEGAIDAVAYRGRAGRARGGHVSPDDESPTEVTIFKSLGMAVEDVAAAHLAYQRATERGLGRGIRV